MNCLKTVIPYNLFISLRRKSVRQIYAPCYFTRKKISFRPHKFRYSRRTFPAYIFPHFLPNYAGVPGINKAEIKDDGTVINLKYTQPALISRLPYTYRQAFRVAANMFRCENV